MQAARHGELTSTLRSRRPQDWRLDLDEALLVHRSAQRPVDLGTDAKVPLHPGTAQVEEPTAQPDLLVDLRSIIEAERRRLSGGEDFDVAVTDLDVAGGQAIVDGAVWSDPHGTDHLEHVLAPNVDRTIDHALDDAGVITQVDEGEVLAMLATATDPSADTDLSADIVDVEVAAEHVSERGGLEGPC